MAWSPLGTQFCLELAFGVLLGLCAIRRAPLGAFFYRLMGTTALVPLLAAFLLPPLFGGHGWQDPAIVAAGLACLAFPIFSGPVKSSQRAAGLAWATVWAAVALAMTVQQLPDIEGAGGWALASLSAMATGAVAGGVGLAMVLGHWYLTVPDLPVSWLRRLNSWTAIAMIVSAVLVVLTCIAFIDLLQDAPRPLLGPWGWFYMGARAGAGLALPLVFAWMTAGSLRHSNTRSATGILYASTVLVLIGTAVSISLQDSYGVPL
jgi:hypothetical protein